MALIRFFRNKVIVGSVEATGETPILDLAEEVGIDISRGCSSGTCGTCLSRLISGEISYPDPLPAGLDDELVEGGYILPCIMVASTACDIEINPPL